MPRAIWSGAISFGLINIPVKLFTAVSDRSVRFHQIDRRNGARVRQKRVNEVDGSEVPYGEIVKGYELAKGSYVTITEEDLASVAPETTHTIDLESFVDLADIDPVYYEGTYFVVPEKSAKPYALLVRAMEESGKVAIGRYVMRTKQYLAVLRPKDGVLLLSQMTYPDEITPAEEIPQLDEVHGVALSERELAMADQLIESLTTEFDPAALVDTYREQLMELIERKATGAEITPAAVGPGEDKVIDLMAALEASVKAAQLARRRSA